MTLHIVKLCVGVSSVDELMAYRQYDRERTQRGAQGLMVHRTRMFPKRVDEIAGKGSLYWVMSGAIRCRQAIVALNRGTDEEGRGYCDIVLDQEIVSTRVQPRRPFQGWRYLQHADIPQDLSSGVVQDEGDASLAAELADLGLL